MSAMSAEIVAVGPLRTQARTKAGEVHHAWNEGGPVVHRINNMTTIQLKWWSTTLDVCATGLEAELTKSPSVSNCVMGNKRLETR